MPCTTIYSLSERKYRRYRVILPWKVCLLTNFLNYMPRQRKRHQRIDHPNWYGVPPEYPPIVDVDVVVRRMTSHRCCDGESVVVVVMVAPVPSPSSLECPYH